MTTPDEVQRTIGQLQEFRIKIRRWVNGNYEPESRDKLRASINRLTPTAKKAGKRG